MKSRGKSTPLRHGSVHFGELKTGRAAGVQTVVLDNGTQQIVACPTRGLGILHLQVGGVRIGWNSTAGEAVHPRWVNVNNAGGKGWLDGFTEMIVRCGLRNIGPSGWDRVDGQRRFVTLHGGIANVPAQEIRVVESRDRLALSGQVTEPTDGPELVMSTRITTRRGSASFDVEDVITNCSGANAEVQILYHSNFGEPILEEGASFLAAADAVASRDGRRRPPADFARCRGRVPNFREEVYFLWPRADSRGRARVALQNATADLAVSITFAVAQLPCLTFWKQTGAGDERYVVGLEPGTSFPLHRSEERRAGRVVLIGPGERYRVRLRYTVHLGRRSVASLQRSIERLQKRQPLVSLSRRAFFKRRAAHQNGRP